MRRVLTQTLLFMFLLGVTGGLWAQEIQNLTVEPEFLCPGSPVTISFQGEAPSNGAGFEMMGDFTTVSSTSFNYNTDYLFLYSGAGNPIAPVLYWNSKTPESYTGDLFWKTYTIVTTVPSAGFFATTGQQVYVNIAGQAAAFWPYSGYAAGMMHLSVAVTVSCTESNIENTGVFGNSGSTASLIISQCGSTNTPTNTDTATITSTPTPSPTMTFTPTITNTTTPTPTPTLINTATVTNTPTSTDTSTITDTPVPSATATNTLTQTATNTITDTDTLTQTPTNSATPTITNTPVPSATATNTFTVTVTSTSTNTAQNTSTPTPSNTPTDTMTPTATFTPTPFVGIGKSVSETEANSGDVLTYTIAVTVEGPELTGAVVTDNLPPDMTYESFGSVPSGTVTTYNAATNQMEWTLPSPLTANVYDFSYELKVNTFAPADVPLTNHAQLTYTGLSSPITASVPVTVIGNFTVSVNIYNSAGEVVKSIPIQQFSTAINNITLSTTNTITALQGTGSSISIIYNGYVIGVWNGTNNSDQPVANGSYKIQVDNASSSGTVTSVSQEAIVNRNESSVEVDIYNSSGEVVRQLYNVISNPITSSMTNVVLSSNVLKPGSQVDSSVNSQVEILVQDSNEPVTLVWDGSNNSGTYVTPGEYQIEVHWTDGSGTTTDISRTVLVLQGTSINGEVLAEPNVLESSNGMTTWFDASSVTNAAGLRVKVYTIDGELIQSLSTSSDRVSWSASSMASGIYIANVEVDNADGGMIEQQRLKILVLH